MSAAIVNHGLNPEPARRIVAGTRSREVRLCDGSERLQADTSASTPSSLWPAWANCRTWPASTVLAPAPAGCGAFRLGRAADNRGEEQWM